MNKKGLIFRGFFVLVLVVLLVSTVSCKKDSKVETVVEKVASGVETATVSLGSVTDYHKFGGIVSAHSSVNAMPETNGKIVEVLVTEGDYVEKDQVIGKIDASRAGQNYMLSPVKAPISGTVSVVNAHVGSQTSPAASFAVIETLDNLEIAFDVIERYVTKIAEGNKATVTFDAIDDEVFDAYVSHVNPTLDSATKTLKAKVKLSSDDSRVKAGMFARLNVITEVKDNVIVVPYSALTVTADETYCYITEGNTAKRIVVTTGIKDNDLVEIKNGLKLGDKLIVKGQNFVSDGDNVRVLN